MKALVLVADYPDNNKKVTLMYVHVRNKYYMENNIEVVVLNFATNCDYVKDKIQVITLETYKKCKENYDVLILHAPNLRNHYNFLKKYENRFYRKIFFFHGHEILKLHKEYPPDYNFIKKNLAMKLIRNFYDNIKLKVWKNYFIKNKNNKLIFVSQWLLDKFLEYSKINYNLIKDRTSIIYNSVGKIFEIKDYDYAKTKKYDFITIRSKFDYSKYALDIVCKLANNNNQFKFLLIGQGQYFKYNKKPNNLIWIDKSLTHEEILEYLDLSFCALLPTRHDTQGVMACEMATYGIPLITSNIPVTKEIFENTKKIYFIENSTTKISLNNIYEDIKKYTYIDKEEKFFAENTIKQEIQIIKRKLYEK